MKKLFISFLSIMFLFGCSTNNGVTTVVPAAPTNLTGAAISATQINLTWTDNSTNEVGYKVQRKTAGGSFADVGSTGTDMSTFSDLGLTNNTAYTYRVYAYNAAGNSLQYSNEVTITTTTGGGGGSSVTDIDGNIYPTVQICNQVWTAKNLDVSHYRNGDVIPQVTDPSQWANLTTGAWCYYNFDITNGPIYGKLYNWYAVHDSRGLSPVGYHVPADSEWNALSLCLADSAGDPGGPMKEAGTSHWLAPNTGATNSSGFTALPAGYICGAQFQGLGKNAIFWNASHDPNSNNFPIGNPALSFDDIACSRFSCNPSQGSSVRCIKD